MLISEISQTNIEKIMCPIDIEPKLIKERKESLACTYEKVKNVPVSASYVNNKNNSKNDNKSKKVDISYTIIPIDFSKVADGKSKPINVNDGMIENIKRNSSIKDFTIDKKSSNDEFLKREVVGNVTFNKESVDNVIFKFDEFKKNVYSKKQQLEKARIEVENSEKTMNELNIQYNELEKVLKQEEEKDKLLEQELLLKFNEQEKLLNKELDNIEKSVIELSEKKKQNEDRIIDFQSKINSAAEKIEKLKNRISIREKLLKNFDNDFNSFYQESTEDVEIKKVV